ncbi:MAG: hypothetical protein ACYDHT_01330 [Solirubrobacteraceae bacterium]
MSFAFVQLLGARQRGNGCNARTDQARRTTCYHTIKRGTLSFKGHAGTNDVAFAGRISHTRQLRPGRYVLTITATNPAGQRSAPVSLSFTITT